MNERTVLLVDDEEDFVVVVAERLQARGLVAETVSSGEAALARVEQRAFDAIVLDMAMPGMDGIQTLKGLLRLNPDLQVILLTGRATLGQAVEAMKLGALDLLEKPVGIDTLVAKIDEAATRKSTLREKRIENTVSDIMRKKGW
jgi:DNA-binding NtrC family response regulator